MTASNKRFALALAVSLGLNVFLGGFIAARTLHRGPAAAHDGGYGPFFGPRGLMRDRKGPAADAARNLMHRQGETFRAERERLHDAQRVVGTALAAEPFDSEALTRALADLRERTARSQELMHSALVELARGLSHEQRRDLARDRRGFGRGMAGHDGP